MMSALRLIDIIIISGVGCVGVLLSSSICAPTLALFSSFDRSHLAIVTLLMFNYGAGIPSTRFLFSFFPVAEIQYSIIIGEWVSVSDQHIFALFNLNLHCIFPHYPASCVGRGFGLTSGHGRR
jgi:hypothetical protein